MKLQCPCGAKYAFDLLPEMVQNPVKFVCPTCGLDSSEFVNDMVRREFGASAPAEPAPPTTPPPAVAPSRLRISHEAKPDAPPPAAAPVSKYCPKHRGVLATEKCAVCQTPICPQCLALFGFFCSPLCKNKADLQGLAVPVYAGQKFEVERQFWRRAGLTFGALLTLLLLLFGAWGWYAFYGSQPHVYYSVSFADDDRGYAGEAQLVGKDRDQLVFLHGGTLARYDLKTKKKVWSQELITPDQVAAVVQAENDRVAKAFENDVVVHRDTPDVIEHRAKVALQAQFQLHLSGQNIWVARGAKLTHYDWDTGNVAGEVPLPDWGADVTQRGDELQVLTAASVTHIDLASGETRVEQFGGSGAAPVAANAGPGAVPATGGGGLFSTDGRPLDPNKVAAQAQNLTLPAREALPALIANNSYEAQLEAALRDDPEKRRPNVPPPSRVGLTEVQLVPGPDGVVQFSRTLLEEKMVERSAMRAAPKQSALDSGNVSVMNQTAAINDQLNEMQRNNGGDTVTEDESRYQVTVRLPAASGIADWTGEVAGPPQFFALKTVNVVAAGKTVIVLDKTNKQLWTASLTYALPAGGAVGDAAKYGEGPCVERNGTLYIFDQAVLSAYDLASGNARWRLPSVGVVGLFFDAQNFLYVNTTSGNPDDVKYSRQIDITKSTDDVLMKLDPQTGRTLWRVTPGGFISYLSGKFIYTVQAYDPNPDDAEQLSDMTLTKPAYFRIARLSPASGRTLWEYYDSRDRCPVDVQFQANTIELVFKKEVQVLKYLAF